MAGARKLDIFALMAAMDMREHGWFERQSEDARKEFAPIVALRWASNVSDGDAAEWYLRGINERVNRNLWELSRHPELVFKLMSSCGIGMRQRHQWLNMPQRRGGGGKAREFLWNLHPEANGDELDLLLRSYSAEEFRLLTEDAALTPDEAKEAQKAHARFNGIEAEASDDGKAARKRRA